MIVETLREKETILSTSRKSRQTEPAEFCERCAAVCNDTCRMNERLTGARDRVLRFGPRL